MTDERRRFLVAPARTGDPRQQQILQQVQTMLAGQSDAAIVQGHGASPSSHLVVDMSPTVAQRLQAQYGQDLIIEPDAPLRY